MKIADVVAANINAWMRASPVLDTIKKVAARSGVGYETVRRARNADGNTTVQNLDAIARAFHRHPADLLTPPTGSCGDVVRLHAAEPAPLPYLVRQIADVAQRMNEVGHARLLERAEQLAEQYPAAKANHAN